MSNPGVITLASLRGAGPNIKRLDIEDNIGEAIHIHWNNFRVDMTIEEFLAFSEEIIQCENELMAMNGVDLSGFDAYFLFRMGSLIQKISTIHIENHKLKNLRCLVRTKIPKLGTLLLPKPIDQTPAFLYLAGKSARFIDYEQDAYPGLDNESRSRSLEKSIRDNGYPSGNEFITLFGHQKYVRDGQHRAAVLAAIHGLDYEVPVKVVLFKDRSWALSPYFGFLRSSARQFAVKALRKIRRHTGV